MLVRRLRLGLRRQVDEDGFAPEVVVQRRRQARAVNSPMRALLKRRGRVALVMISDRLRSYDTAKQEIMPRVEHRYHKELNNLAEKFAQPLRRRERIMKRFKSGRHLQRRVSIPELIADMYHLPCNDITSSHPCGLRLAAMNLWPEVSKA